MAQRDIIPKLWLWQVLLLYFVVPASTDDSPRWTLQVGGLEVIIEQVGQGLTWRTISWIGGGGEGEGQCEDQLQLGALFALQLPDDTIFTSMNCSLQQSPSVSKDAETFSATMDCPAGPRVEFSASVQALPWTGGAALRTWVKVSQHKIVRLALLLVPDGPCVAEESTGSVDGSPVRTGRGRFLMALEHPLAKHHLGGETQTWIREPPYAIVAEVTHLKNVSQGQDMSPLEYGAVVVGVAEPSTQGRRTFFEYLSGARPKNSWQGPLVHYNSWYDFTSWQDEGFFAKRYPDLMKTLRQEPMNEEGCLSRVAGFAPLVQRGAKLDSFLWDDGWDDPHALWTFDREKFPRGFEKVAAKAAKMGAGLSVWLSPWGGYGQAKDERVRLAKEQGFETNENGLSLAGPRYAARFKAAVHDFRRTARVNMFKFDGVAGDPATLSAEVEGMLGICRDLREESVHNSSGGSEEEGADKTGEENEEESGSDKDPFWINLTTGTWPSPFFLLWVDSIWRGMTDTHIPRWPSLQGLTTRQTWQVWRECVVQELIVNRAALFPISRLMVHGAILASHGDALANGLHQLEQHDWAQEVWSLAAMGLQLQELYISTKFMSDWAWDELAAALIWARNNSQVLEDSHWAIPGHCREASESTTKKTFRPYAIASYRPAVPGLAAQGGRGFMFFRNPRSKGQKVTKFRFAEALELPLASANSTVRLRLVRRTSVSRLREPGLDCADFVPPLREVADGECEAAADVALRFPMSAGEVLVLDVDVPAWRQPAKEAEGKLGKDEL